MFERTIAKRVEAVGVGLHSGEAIKLVLEPLSSNSGIVFYHIESGVEIKLNVKNITETKLATTLGKKPNSISTIEHFLSAIYAYGIDNLKVIVYGNEMPIMDGSAMPFCMLLDEAGIAYQDRLKEIILIKKEITLEESGKKASLKPSKRAKFNFSIDFPHPIIGKEEFSFNFSKVNFIEQIARARTFGFLKDIEYLQSMNLALGASLENAIGLDENSVLNPEGLRYKDEFVRHKILDAMGDMMVLGKNIIGEYSAIASSHDLNHKLTLKLLNDSKAYEVVRIKEYEESLELVKVFV